MHYGHIPETEPNAKREFTEKENDRFSHDR
jgi:hypothetical protein